MSAIKAQVGHSVGGCVEAEGRESRGMGTGWYSTPGEAVVRRDASTDAGN